MLHVKFISRSVSVGLRCVNLRAVKPGFPNLHKRCICSISIKERQNFAREITRGSQRKQSDENNSKSRFNWKHVAFAAGAVIFTDKDDSEPWFIAVNRGDIRTVERMIADGYDVNKRHLFGWTALMSAVANRQIEMVKVLLQRGAVVNAKDRFSNSYKAASQCNEKPQVVNEFRNSEFCNFFNNSVSFRGFTALHYAVLVDDLDLVRLLLDHGADPRAANADGHLPIEYAHPDSAALRKSLVDAESTYEKRKREERARVPLETRLRGNLVGQDEAIRAVSAAVRRKEGGWHAADRPLVFLFVGSSGIGKTELAKHIAVHVHGDESQDEADDEQQESSFGQVPWSRSRKRKQNPAASFEQKGFVRIDMTEYGEKHEVAKLIGAPPGYIGYEEGGQLTRKLAACPNAVVLLDEVEKAHPDVLNVLLALFDEGRITDSNGQTVQCRDAIFIMTSNLAAREIAEFAANQRNSGSSDVVLNADFKDRVIRPILSGHFRRDEFLGRIDEIVYFVPFSDAQLADLVVAELKLWRERSIRKHRVAISWTDDVVELLKRGYDVHFGARSIKHEVERRLISLLALAHERGIVEDGSTVQFNVKSNADSAQALRLLVEKDGSFVDAFEEGLSVVAGSRNQRQKVPS